MQGYAQFNLRSSIATLPKFPQLLDRAWPGAVLHANKAANQSVQIGQKKG